jgi:hypothetical protein
MNRTTFVRRAAGVSGLLLLAAVAGSSSAPASQLSSAAQAATPRVLNGQADSRPVGGRLDRAVDGLAARESVAWVGYVVDGVPGDYGVGDEYGSGAPCGTVYLEGRRPASLDAAKASPRPVAVLLRVTGGAVRKIRVIAADCDLEAGGLAVHWLAGVDPAESVSMLSRYVRTAAAGRPAPAPSWNSALSALALHATPEATRALERFVAAGQPPEIRKRAAFWLGTTRGAEGFATLRRYAEADPDAAFRKALPFALSASGDPAAVGVLVEIARNDASGDVRRQAIFWLGQKAGAKVAGTLADAVANDPETAVKERAVFALSRLPNGEGVDKLIDVAKTSRDPLVRKRAVFWLAQSSDPRALEYITKILVGK